MRNKIKQAKRFTTRLWGFALWRIACPAIYRVGCLRPINQKLALFVHDHEHTPGDNFIPVIKLLEKRGFTCVFFGKIKGQGSRLQKYKNLLRFVWMYPTARTVFLMEVSQRLDICRPRRGTEIIQLWHGCGAFKQWGYSTIDRPWGSSAKTYKWFPATRFYTHTSVSAAEVIPHYAEAFNCCPSTIVPWGVPRTDFFFREGSVEKSRERVMKAMPDIGERKIVLYAPTFRGNSMRKAKHDDVLDYNLMQKSLGEDCALLLKPHPRARKSIPNKNAGEAPFVFDASALPIEALLCAADLVITDYSSLIFEYSLLERPMLFYAYDLENYEDSRSFYYPYMDFVPGDLVWDTEDIITGIQANLLEGKFDVQRVQLFREKFMSACDGKSTRRIVKNVLGV